MPEIWMPPPREAFTPHEHEAKEVSKAAQYLSEVLDSLKQVPRVNAKMGAEMGKAFIHVYETGADRLTPAQYRVIQDYVLRIFGEKTGRIYISGFLTELAAASIFTDLDLPVYYPLEQEDLTEGVDWWMDGTDIGIGALPIQVKSIPLREGVKNEVIYPVRTERELQILLDTLILPFHLDVPSSRQSDAATDLRAKVTSSARKLMTAQERYSDVTPTMMFLQSPNSGGAQFNTLTGKPNRAVLDRVFAQLEEFPRINQ